MLVILKQITFVTLSLAVPAAAMWLFAGMMFGEGVGGTFFKVLAISPGFGLIVGTIRGVRELRGTLKPPTVEQQRRFERLGTVIFWISLAILGLAGVAPVFWALGHVAGPQYTVRVAIKTLVAGLAGGFVLAAVNPFSQLRAGARLTGAGIAALILSLAWAVL